jgi:hypothetical protein
MRAWGDFLAPDVIWRPPEEWPEPRPYVGRESVLREVQQLRETWGPEAIGRLPQDASTEFP